MPSRRFPVRVHDLAERIGAIGKLPVIDALTVSGPPPPADTAAKPWVEHLLGSLSLLDGVSLPAGPVLLVDDTYRSGWTMTVAAALLRDAGRLGRPPPRRPPAPVGRDVRGTPVGPGPEAIGDDVSPPPPPRRGAGPGTSPAARPRRRSPPAGLG